ncbi:glycosyltransferase [Thalassotalea piscium]|uniref:Glycosyltransferase involved in cell wall biosynthesis n=1 Tax=Thalassotalea piscium TaxID=1230533 RepID=A0A7X0NJ92_9GAMM|nr:glycosyltransferase [Thalassotalea piscium]MBB6544435.1 glycosyltransferase involved in cell wall biosynthesis [Thalassotalea piscium]
MSKKVLHIFGIMNRGGAELRTLDTLSPLAKKGVALEFCALTGRQGVLDQGIVAQQSKVHYCRLGVLFPLRFFLLLKKHNFDCVHSHVADVSGVILFIAWLAGVKQRIAHYRSTQVSAQTSLVKKMRNRCFKQLIDWFATDIIGVCNAALNAFWSNNWQQDKRCRVIYNGLQRPPISTKQPEYWHQFKLTKDLPVVINIARMDPPKNHGFIIDVFIALFKKQPCYLVLVGKENTTVKHALLERLEAENLTEYVLFAQEQANVYPFIQHANAMLFPSLWEGLPGAVIEAASLGLPVISSALAGVDEIAQYLPCVKQLPLTAEISAWETALTNAFAQTEESQQQAQHAFTQSPFNITLCVESLYAVYK